MKLILQNEGWFSTNDAAAAFEGCEGLEDRSGFLYSYLKAICKEQNKEYEDSILFRIAFLLADGVWEAKLPYCTIPDFLSPKENPFLAYVRNVASLTTSDNFFIPLLSVLHQIADPFSKQDWIFTIDFKDADAVGKKLTELGHLFIIYGESLAQDAEAFRIDSKLDFVQLQIIALFSIYGKSVI